MNTKGIIIIATAHPIYGRMAYNLALTIKATGTSVPVALIHDPDAVSDFKPAELDLFDHHEETNLNWNGVRFNIDVLSPFDHTLQLDADMLWLYKDPAELFEKYTDEELLVTNEGYYDIDTGKENLTGDYKWLADLNETIAAYNLTGKLYQMRWELLLFKKTDRVRSMLARAAAIREQPLVETWKFEGQTVDEFCFYVACNEMKFNQAEAPFVVSYWCRKLSNPLLGTIGKLNYAIGFGGNSATKEYKRMYNLVMANACKKMGLRQRFGLQSKKDYLTSRIAI